MRLFARIVIAALCLAPLPSAAGPVDDDPGKGITDRLLEVQDPIGADLRSREIGRFRKGARRLEDEVARTSAILDAARLELISADRGAAPGTTRAARARAAERCYAIAAATRNFCQWARVEFQVLEPPGGDPDELLRAMRAAQILENRAFQDLKAARASLKAAGAAFRNGD